MRTFIIAEKYSLAMEIKKMLTESFGEKWSCDSDCYVSANYYLSYFYGHLFELYTPDEYDPKYSTWKSEDLPIIPQPFKYRYKRDRRTIGKKLADISQKTDLIINACDPGREGEGIFRIWFEQEKINKPVKRLWARSLALKDLTSQWSKMKDGCQYDKLALAQRCRMKSDWLIGINVSRAYSIASGEKVPIGRVLTTVCAIVVSQDEAVKTYTESYYYQLMGEWNKIVFTYIDDKETKFESLEHIDNVKKECIGKQFSLQSYADDRKIKNPPKPYSTAELQKDANNIYGYTLDKTLNITKKLYETKLVTYPRTNSQYLSPADEDKYYDLIDKMASEVEKQILIPKGNKIPCLKNTKSEHTAIIPTDIQPQELTDEEENVYSLIVKRFITAFLKPFIYDQTTICINNGKHSYRAIVNYTIEKGFRDIVSDQKNDEDTTKESEEQELIAKIDKTQFENSTLINNLTVQKKKRTRPKYFTPATLLTAMINIGKTVEDIDDRTILNEVDGIGTPATRDKIVVDLVRYGYVEYCGKSIKSTTKGKELVAWVKDDLKSAELTAQYERKLREIENGSYDSNEFMNEIRTFVIDAIQVNVNGRDKFCSTLNAEKRLCPKCRHPLNENDKGYFCSSECGFTLFKTIAKKRIPIKNINALFETGNSGIIDGFSKKDNTGTFSAAVVIKPPKYEVTFKFEVRNSMKCPICGSCLSEFSRGIKCENVACGFIIWRVVSEKKIPEGQLKRLIRDGKTGVINGFISRKNGKPFSAALTINRSKKNVEYVFSNSK